MIIDIDAPMEGCNKCVQFDLTTEIIYEDGEVHTKVVRCRNAEICRNAINLYKGETITWCDECKYAKKCYKRVGISFETGGYAEIPLKYCSQGERK